MRIVKSALPAASCGTVGLLDCCPTLQPLEGIKSAPVITLVAFRNWRLVCDNGFLLATVFLAASISQKRMEWGHSPRVSKM
jgi:hypothetical protein